MKLSHSKLSTILTCPMTYYLQYVQGIYKKVEKTALSLGSAVHYGLQYNLEDLSDYYKNQGNFKQRDNYTDEELLAEAMLHCYLNKKDSIMKDILFDNDTGKTLKCLEETHELFLTGKLKSFQYSTDTEFVGIIDLLLLTEKGFVIIDYKTSSKTPNFDNYLDQIYRYIMLVESTFPGIPVYKIGIINLRKASIRKKKTENNESFKIRLKHEYDVDDTDSYISYHVFEQSKLNKDYINDYIQNLSHMCDYARLIDENKLLYINYGNAINIYGKSDFYDIFYKTPDSYMLYAITDTIYNKDTNELSKSRDCNSTDMKVIDTSIKVLNHYDTFKIEFERYLILHEFNVNNFIESIKDKYVFDKQLISQYVDTYIYLRNK